LNNVKVLIALLGVWKNLRIKKVRLSPTFVTILVASLSCNLALSAKAETHNQDSVQEINPQTAISSVKPNFLLTENYEILANQKILKINARQTHLQTNFQQLHPSCQIEVAAVTPKCNSQHQSLLTQYQDINTDSYIKTLTQVPREETPGIENELPIEETPTEETPGIENEIPIEDIPTEETPRIENEIPIEETPTEETPGIENEVPPTEDIPTEETPGIENELPREKTPRIENEIPIEETPTEETPRIENEVPPTEDIPTEETPGIENEIPTEETPTTSEEPRVLVAEVAVVGVEDELEDIVYETIDTEPGRTTTRSQLQEDINAVYATGLFQNIEVIPEDTPLGVRITITVEANPILNKVVVNTIPSDSKKRVLPPEKIDEFFGDRYSEILNLRDLQQGIKQINQWYAENGYELAQVVGSPQVSPDGTVTLVVAEGVIEDIQVRFFDEEDEPTDGKTRDFIVTREIELKSGDIFKRDTAQRDLQRVFGLGIFEDVRLSFSPGQDPSKVIVNVDVVESSTGSVAAGAGFSSSSGLFGTVSYQQKNLGGNNQTLGTEIQLGERELLFDVSFTDPWIAGDPYRTSYTVNAFRRRSISLVFDGDDEDIRTEQEEDSPRVVRTGGGVNFSRPLSDNPFKRAEWTLSTGFQYQHVDLIDDDGNVSPVSREEDGGQNLAFSDSGKDDLFIFRFGATQDKRNNRIQPTKGSLLRVGMEQTAPIGSGSILFNRVRANYSYYVPLNLIRFTEGPQAITFNVQAGTVLGDLPPYEAFVMGGSNSVRGFAEGEVGNGRSYFQASAEYRFPIFRIVGGAMFFDYGTVLGTDDNVPGEPSIRRELPGSGFGYGVGIRVQSPLGPIRVDYAINDDGDNRIHFGIGERF
jgi:outer membrane protein insertion porin family